MYASVRVDGKFLEVVGGGGGPFPFKIAESSRRSFQEFWWLVVQMVRFCFSKGEPLWERTFRWGNRCLLLQLRKNGNGRFIVFSLLGDGGQSRTVIFPEGVKADGWLGVAKILKEALIVGHKKSSPSSMNACPCSRFFVDRKLPFANVVRGQSGGSVDSHLMGWRCRACGSWDVFAAVIGEVQDGSGTEQDQQAPSKDGLFEASLSPGKTSSPKDREGVSPPVANQFKVLNDMLVNYSSSDGECSPHINSPTASRIPESLLINVGGLDLSVRSPFKGALVYTRRKKFGLEMIDADVRSEPVLMQDQGGQSVLEEELHQTLSLIHI